ncbi:MAG: LemA family protein [Candidatus Gracilibacteria bacterium]
MDISLIMILGIIVLVVGVIYIITYNSIIRTRNNVEENVSAIDTVFQNRYDLIPNLVEVVKQYASHEKNLLEGVTKLRSGAMSGQEMTKEKLENENMLSGTLKSIFALAENYPDLKANENFINLQNEWTEIEDKMQAARRSYNASVKALRDIRQMFPSSIVAGMMTLKTYDMFEASEESRKSLDAKKLFNK